MTDYNDGNWHAHNGGERPVHQKSVVDYVWHDPNRHTAGYREGRTYVVAWAHVVKFRVTEPYVEPKNPREWWKDDTNTLWETKGQALGRCPNGKPTLWREVPNE